MPNRGRKSRLPALGRSAFFARTFDFKSASGPSREITASDQHVLTHDRRDASRTNGTEVAARGQMVQDYLDERPVEAILLPPEPLGSVGNDRAVFRPLSLLDQVSYYFRHTAIRKLKFVPQEAILVGEIAAFADSERGPNAPWVGVTESVFCGMAVASVSRARMPARTTNV